MSNLAQLAKEALDRIRPYVRMDGGDIEFVSIDSEGVVKVRMLGACNGCSAIGGTFEGVEAIMMEEVPGVTKVILEDYDPFAEELF